MSLNKKPGLPFDLLNGVYRPEFEPDVSNIIGGEIDPEAVVREAEEQVAERLETAQRAISDGPERLLSEEEAKQVDRKIEDLQAEISAARGRISKFKEHIDQQATGPSGNEVQFKLDLKRKPQLRRAIAQLFGVPYTEITYSMYLEAKKMKRELESSEAKDYVAGNW